MPILTIIIVLLLIGGLPSWGYYPATVGPWSWSPSLVLLIVLLVLLFRNV
jgi:hypothetical protein